MAYRFRFLSSYMGTVDYEVTGPHEAPYRVSVRQSASDYERSIYNGGDAEWQRDVVGAIGLITRHSDPSRPVPEDAVAAFNAWRAQTHADQAAAIRAEPARYGKLAEDDPIITPPPAVKAATYVIGQGWIS